MSKFDERLDEIIQNLSLTQQFLGEQYTHNRIDELQFQSKDDDARDEAKQAILSLIKELVAEAKPTRSETQIGNFIIYGDLSKRDLKIIHQFEQNLLKKMEEEV